MTSFNWAKAKNGRVRAVLAGLSVAFMLTGCSLFDDDRPKPVAGGPSQAGNAARTAANQRGNPGLGSVPARPAPSTDRRALEQGLAADRDQARYSDDQLRGRPASAPAPAPAPAQSFANAPPPRPPQGPQAAPGGAYYQNYQAARPAPQGGIPVYPGEEAVAQSYVAALQQSAVSQVPSDLGSADSAGQAGFRGLAQRVATIVFTENSANLDERDRQIIAAVASEQKRGGGNVRVIGYASSRTPDLPAQQHNQANYNVSMRRAQAIGNELIRRGVPRGSVMVEARADADPVYYESKPEAEAYNRRAEIFIER